MNTTAQERIQTRKNNYKRMKTHTNALKRIEILTAYVQVRMHTNTIKRIEKLTNA